MGEFFRRIHYLIYRRRFDRELESDMEFHREMAAREGRKNFGNTLRLREQSREAWGWTWMDRLIQDLRYAARMLWRSPGFTLTAVLVLAVGVGVNITAFSVFNMLALKLLPVPHPEQLVRMERKSPCCTSTGMPYASLVFYRDHARSLQAVMASMGDAPMMLEDGAQPVTNVFVTPNYFSQLGSTAAAGRLLDAEQDGGQNALPVVVLSYGFWQRKFGADRSIIGKVIRLNKKPATVIGIISETSASLDGQRADVWLPIQQQPYFVDGSTMLTEMGADKGAVCMFGRLAPGVTAKAAEQELRALTNDLRKQYPKDVRENEYLNLYAAGHMQSLRPDMLPVIAMGGALSLLILAVACANLGGLLLARGVKREHEIAIRLSIGASRKRIFRQLLTESLLLALIGSFTGLALGYSILRIMLAKTEFPAWASAAPDWRVLLFGIVIGLLSCVLFGFAPALQISRQRQRRPVVRQVLVSAQIAASCILLIVAGLLVRAVDHALHTSPGWGYEQVLSVNLVLGNHGYTPTASRSYLEELKNRLRSMPGITSVGLSSMPPLGHGRISTIGTEVGGRSMEVYPFQVDPDFFQTMSIPILKGRNLFPGEANAVIVSDSIALRQWPGEDPIGKQFWDKDTVVGVAGSARMIAPNDNDAAEIYHAAQPADMPGIVMVVKTAGSSGSFVPMIKSAVEGIDPHLFPEVRVLKSAFKQGMNGIERLATMVSLLGVAAILLAGIGIVGLVAYSVSQKTKEIAIRIALGAKPLHVFSVVLRQFILPVLLGMIAGTAGTIALSRFLRQLLYGISNLDPAGYAVGISVLLAIALVAMLLPARRALHIDPARALHEE